MREINKGNLKTFLSDEMAALGIYQGMMEDLESRFDFGARGPAGEELGAFKKGIRGYLHLKGTGLDWLKEGLGIFGKYGLKMGMLGVDSDLKAFEVLQRVSSGAYGTKIGWWAVKEVAEEAGDYQLARLAEGAIALSERHLAEFENLIRLVGREAFLDEASSEVSSLKLLKEKL